MSLLSDAIDPEALLKALAQQQQPLPVTLQQSLQETVNHLHPNQPHMANQLRRLIEQYAPLEQAYMKALENLDEQYQAQRRTKSLTLSLNGFSNQNLESILIHLLKESTDVRPTARKVVNAVLEQRVSETQEVTVLKALEKRPLTPQSLTYAVNLPSAQAQAVVQLLWRKGDIDRVTGNLFYSLFPMLRNWRDRDREVEPNTYLTITTQGYFRLHPVITPSYRGKRA